MLYQLSYTAFAYRNGRNLRTTRLFISFAQAEDEFAGSRSAWNLLMTRAPRKNDCSGRVRA
jgi:hypothetical protein